MNSIKVLDVTLRDGGCVNDFNFGQEYMDKILSALEKTGVEYIELGYLDNKAGSVSGRTKYCDEQVIKQYFMKSKKDSIKYVAMMDYGKFNVDDLHEKTEDDIDGIRLAFHKKNWKEALELGRKIIDKGYEFFIQPMLTLRYTDAELLELISVVNTTLPDAKGFYIVDSFGEMRGNDVVRLMNLVDHNLVPTMTLGLHSHNNLQLSYSNAMSVLEFPTKRNIMLDSSVMGMGKGAGNLNTELLMEHMNLYYDKQYQIAPLMELIDQVISVIHKEMYWGYSVEYYLSSVNRCTPSYAAHFYGKHMLPIDQVAELLGMIDEDKKNSFDVQYAENLYVEYNSNKTYNDDATVTKLRKLLEGKKILLIAPGKSIKDNKEKIISVLNRDDVVSIALNNLEFNTDYVLTTRTEAYEQACKMASQVIAPSNVTMKCQKNVEIIDYKKWIISGEHTYDSSSVMALNLIKTMAVSEVILAGFDGFSVNINDNYYNPVMRHPVTEEQAKARNSFFKEFISNINKEIRVTFLTDSKYM